MLRMFLIKVDLRKSLQIWNRCCEKREVAVEREAEGLPAGAKAPPGHHDGVMKAIGTATPHSLGRGMRNAGGLRVGDRHGLRECREGRDEGARD